jgi:hypothetical protein
VRVEALARDRDHALAIEDAIPLPDLHRPAREGAGLAGVRNGEHLGHVALSEANDRYRGVDIR